MIFKETLVRARATGDFSSSRGGGRFYPHHRTPRFRNFAVRKFARHFASRNLRPRVVLTTGNKRAKREKEKEREREREREIAHRQPQWRSFPPTIGRTRGKAARILQFALIYVRCTKANISSRAKEDRAIAVVQGLLTHTNYSSLWHSCVTHPVLDIDVIKGESTSENTRF